MPLLSRETVLLFFSFPPPSVYANFSWHAASVNEVHCYVFVSHGQHVKNTRQMWLKQQDQNSVFLDLCYMEPYGLVSEQSSAVSAPRRCIKN